MPGRSKPSICRMKQNNDARALFGRVNVWPARELVHKVFTGSVNKFPLTLAVTMSFCRPNFSRFAARSKFRENSAALVSTERLCQQRKRRSMFPNPTRAGWSGPMAGGNSPDRFPTRKTQSLQRWFPRRDTNQAGSAFIMPWATGPLSAPTASNNLLRNLTSDRTVKPPYPYPYVRE